MSERMCEKEVWLVQSESVEGTSGGEANLPVPVPVSGSESVSGQGQGQRWRAGAGAGPGWRAALEALGESGDEIARAFDRGGIMDSGAGEEVWPEFGEEWQRGARWRRYGRCGEVCALLRQAGRRARPRKE